MNKIILFITLIFALPAYAGLYLDVARPKILKERKPNSRPMQTDFLIQRQKMQTEAECLSQLKRLQGVGTEDYPYFYFKNATGDIPAIRNIVSKTKDASHITPLDDPHYTLSRLVNKNHPIFKKILTHRAVFASHDNTYKINHAIATEIKPEIKHITVGRQYGNQCGAHALKNAYCLLTGDNKGLAVRDLTNENSPFAKAKIPNLNSIEWEDLDALKIDALAEKLHFKNYTILPDPTQLNPSYLSDAQFIKLFNLLIKIRKKASSNDNYQSVKTDNCPPISNDTFLSLRMNSILEDIKKETTSEDITSYRLPVISGNMITRARTSNERIGNNAGSYDHWVTVMVEITPQGKIVFHCADSTGKVSQERLNHLTSILNKDPYELHMARLFDALIPDQRRFEDMREPVDRIINDFENIMNAATQHGYNGMPQFQSRAKAILTSLNDMAALRKTWTPLPDEYIERIQKICDFATAANVIQKQGFNIQDEYPDLHELLNPKESGSSSDDTASTDSEPGN